MFKLVFALICLVICSGMGFIKSYKLKGRLNNLREFKNALRIFQGCIRFTYTNLETAFNETDRLCQIPDVFSVAAKNIKAIGASKAWQYAINKSASSLYLTSEDTHTLLMLGTKLGMVDEYEQIKTIECVLNMLDTHIASAQFDAEKYCRLYSSGGILAGAFICLVLV